MDVGSSLPVLSEWMVNKMLSCLPLVIGSTMDVEGMLQDCNLGYDRLDDWGREVIDALNTKSVREFTEDDIESLDIVWSDLQRVLREG